MLTIKYIGIFLIFFITSMIGVLYSKKYSSRVRDLEEMGNALNMFEAKIKFTYKPIPDVFKEISNQVSPNIGNIFKIASNYMDKNDVACVAWEKGIDEAKIHTNLSEEDIAILKNLSKMLGNTDIEGQVSSIKLVSKFLDKQIENAQAEKIKNEKLYRVLGTGIGLTIAIILI